MSGDTKIEWATKVWNPFRGCSKVSEGCRNCYAIKMANRFSGDGGHYEGLVKKTNSMLNWTGIVQRAPQVLKDPLSWKKHQRIFMNSMSDLFHESIEDWMIDEVFGIVLACHVLENRQSHTFMSLTKRPERQREYFSASPRELIKRWTKAMDGVVIMDNPDMMFSEYVASFSINQIFPLPNYWVGTSVENQEAADKRVPEILQVPAAIRFLSMEPLLGPVDLTKVNLPEQLQPDWSIGNDALKFNALSDDEDRLYQSENHISWVITGGESGPNARPSNSDWFRSIRDQCTAVGVAFHFKQYGEWIHNTHHNFKNYDGMKVRDVMSKLPNGFTHVDCYRKIGKKNAGRLLDGRTWDEFPDMI